MPKAKSSTTDKTLLLVDSHALIHRAYHAFPPDLRTKEGEVVNAVYGFARLLMEVLAKFKPTHVVALFDSPGKTVRHDQFIGYKANRKSPEDDLIKQIPRIEEMLAKFDIPCLRVAGYEADDLIGTIDARHSGAWAKTVIVTGDRDLFQLVDEDTFVYLAGSSFSKSQLFDAKGVEEKMGIGPEYITDLKGLYGDTSDNIPGVYGIGEKGAIGLIQEFGHVEDVFKNLGRIPSRYQSKLINNFEQAELSKQLATIITDVPISFDFEKEATFGEFDLEGLKRFYREMDFNSLLASIEKISETYKPLVAEHAQVQLGLAVPTLDMAAWVDAEIKSDVVFVDSKINKEGDPLNWKLESITLLADDKLAEVQPEQFAALVQNLIGKSVVTLNTKDLMHALINNNLDTSELKFVDIGLSTYILSAGRTKQTVESVVGYYRLAEGQPLPQLWQEIYNHQQTEFEASETMAFICKLEQDLMPVVMEMERQGIAIDVPKLEGFTKTIETKIADITAEIYADVGHEFNISSPKQVGEILFVEKALPNYKKTKTGSFSTDERTLRDLIGADPVVQKILDYRELTKLLSTYLQPLPGWVNVQTGHIHATFNQLGAVTGRFSSTNPNMQNLPLGEVAGINIRQALVADENSKLVAFDYSQQELRLLAELSKEQAMMDSFVSGEDIHNRTAAEIFDIEISQVTSEQRKVGKTVNFGIIYGMSGFGLADRLKIDPKKANDYVRLYFQRYPGVKNYYDRLISEAKTQGYVTTMFGRKRDAFGLTAANFQLRQATEREVMNYPLQGSAADIIKLAMVEVQKVIQDYPAKLALQIHDELVFQYNSEKETDDLVRDEQFLEFITKVKQAMLGVVDLQVPFAVGVEVGENLADMAELE